MSDQENTRNTAPALSVDDILSAQAKQEMTRSSNRVKTAVLLASIVEFVNSDAKTMQHFEAKYPTVTVARLRSVIKANEALQNIVWPIQHDEFGIVLVNVTK